MHLIGSTARLHPLTGIYEVLYKKKELIIGKVAIQYTPELTYFLCQKHFTHPCGKIPVVVVGRQYEPELRNLSERIIKSMPPDENSFDSMVILPMQFLGNFHGSLLTTFGIDECQIELLRNCRRNYPPESNPFAHQVAFDRN